jgi:hypothetical protein
MDFEGVIIEESLEDISILDNVEIKSTKVEEVTPEHKTPWFKHWTLHTVTIPESRADQIAESLSRSLDYSHGTSWYADFKNDTTHYIIFQNKIFRIDRSKKEEYEAATAYGISLGIPPYQVDFAPNVMVWER